jgi:hypothetical protein
MDLNAFEVMPEFERPLFPCKYAMHGLGTIQKMGSKIGQMDGPAFHRPAKPCRY